MSLSAFVCQESWAADGTASCLRFSDLKYCKKDAESKNLNFYCVDENTISIGGKGPKPLPSKLNMTVYMCNQDSCPNEAPPKPAKDEKEDKKDKDNSNAGGSGTPTSAAVVDKKTTLSGLFVLGLIASQMLLF
ncbi:hypothetical protein BG011_000968 [Mortierella polycephala]|uniref:Uncharacterized protein n=1 Tax=Mortierella polycephala TaxID=41804 RepID=A0A9P6Q824_9FUNG|nr:hypothetical protein BG011_000968 [Mortierella polycephala]